jgi:hypothetical protein
MLNRVTPYAVAWNSINNAANDASASVTNLINNCPAYSAAANLALTSEVNPVLTAAADALSTSAAARAMVDKVQTELNNNSTSPDTASTYATDIQTLQTMPPSLSDLADAQQEAQVMGEAKADSNNSLLVSGGTFMDQMKLIAANADALLASDACQQSLPSPSGP